VVERKSLKGKPAITPTNRLRPRTNTGPCQPVGQAGAARIPLGAEPQYRTKEILK